MALLSIIITAYNEEGNIKNTNQVLKDILEKEKIEYELIFISDGSIDEKYQI